MATEKRKIESLEADAAELDNKISQAQQRLRTLKQARAELQQRIENAKAFQIYGILQSRNLSFEEAAKILETANPVFNDNDTE